MIDRRDIESELIDLSRFAHLAKYIGANITLDENAVGRLSTTIDMLADVVLAAEERIMEKMFPPAA